MRSFLLGLSFSIVFIAGCVTATVASQFVIPPARAGTTPQKWEYMCPGASKGRMELFNKAGAKGWEMITAWDSNCFKRPLP